ncbi:hypothetical protein HOLleu_31037 [Holothuria leucospilota]|uniref:Uncharacterized protein n=1 Tax=Holothuria leucospilota TaxID=206669 RepID=A0A9Q1BLB3_HOLLE|nr:hypothetical protein HOLleu_31037 [Holothuria leucospilota]
MIVIRCGDFFSTVGGGRGGLTSFKKIYCVKNKVNRGISLKVCGGNPSTPISLPLIVIISWIYRAHISILHNAQGPFIQIIPYLYIQRFISGPQGPYNSKRTVQH